MNYPAGTVPDDVVILHVSQGGGGDRSPAVEFGSSAVPGVKTGYGDDVPTTRDISSDFEFTLDRGIHPSIHPSSSRARCTYLVVDQASVERNSKPSVKIRRREGFGLTSTVFVAVTDPVVEVTSTVTW